MCQFVQRICVLCGVLWPTLVAAQELYPEDFRLPEAVSGSANRVIPSGIEEIGDQFFEIRFESGPDWSRFELWMDQGGFGLRLIQFAIVQDGEQLLYNDMARRATITDFFKRLGWGTGEVETSPVAVIRAVRYAIAAGYEVTTVQLDNGNERLSWTNDDTRQTFAVEINRQAEKIVSLTMGTLGTQGGVVHRYEDWEPLPGGLHYPRRIEFGTTENYSGEPLVGHVQITEIKALRPGAKPSDYELPPDTIIENHFTSKITNAAGDNIKVEEEEAVVVSSGTASLYSGRNLLIAIAAITAALAGLVTVLKRKGVM